MNKVYALLTVSLITTGSLAQLDPNTAPRTPVDRFSASAGTLMVRDATNGLPAANAPIDFDQAPFITKGIGPNGDNIVEYYNFDVKSTTPAPIYVLIRNGETMPVADQLNIVDVKPGDVGYNDFWIVNIVTVPMTYVANTVHSYQQIMDSGFTVTPMTDIVNCPVVPPNSSAEKRFMNGDTSIVQGWYKDSVIHYFSFVEKALSGTMVPLSPIYVTFNINPGMTGGGPASGFVTEMGSDQTHNVVATVPTDASYSPLWDVNIYDNADFNSVDDYTSATSANVLAMSAAMVNCPVVTVSPGSVGIDDVQFLNSADLYPNPFTDNLNISLSLEEDNSVDVSIINVLGEIVRSYQINSGSSSNTTYDLSDLESGLYTVRFTSNNQFVSRQVVKL